MPAQKKEDLKQIPGFSTNVRTNAAARMVKLAQPICPFSKVKMIRTPEGRSIPDPNQDMQQSCQSGKDQDQETRRGWWNECEARGHDPYFTTRIWYSEEDIVNEETGEVERTKKVRHTDRRPNISQVSAGVRVNSGQRGAQYKIQRFGFKRLPEIGYAEVCQFRNCQDPVTVTSRFGKYCGVEHATLIAADQQGLILTQKGSGGVDWDLGEENSIGLKRARQLTEAQTFAGIRPIK